MFLLFEDYKLMQRHQKVFAYQVTIFFLTH